MKEHQKIRDFFSKEQEDRDGKVGNFSKPLNEKSGSMLP